MLRTHTCGELRTADNGKDVTLCGWVSTVRNLGSLCFVDLRDKYGITQLNIPADLYHQNPLKSEYCVSVTGKVQLRQEKNPALPTGEIEIDVKSYEIFSKSETTPFEIKDDTNASEDTRLIYRYLDLRRPVMQKYLKIRSDINRYTREYLCDNGFQEIDTPTLIKSTPEGARDYLVPSRIYPGNFYALPQSPQLYKQLLMIAGTDRYFQLAHCYRDEDQRADRQPEFMQIDCEMSFVTREDVLNVIEGLLDYLFLKIRNVKLPKFVRMDYDVAIHSYGTDKPDLRFDMLLNDVTEELNGCGFKAYEGKNVIALVVPTRAKETTRKQMDQDNLLAKKFHVFGVSHLKYENGELNGSITKNINPDNLAKLKAKLNLHEDDLLILCADEKKDKACCALGALRNYYGNLLGYCKKDDFKPLFVINWPLFERDEEGNIVSLSNPFTRPNDEDLHYLDEDPTLMHSTSYDTVLNGVELSSGALRIHDSKIQEKVFELLGLTEEDINVRFGFFVKALKYGVPPEGGFGIGIERLAMELAETDNVRDVVAFPKNLKAFEPMSSCPSRVPENDTDILGIKLVDTLKEGE